MAPIQVQLSDDEQEQRLINVEEDASFKQFFDDSIVLPELDGFDVHEMTFKYGGKELQCHVTELGSSDTKNSMDLSENQITLQPWPGRFTITNEPDMISYDNDTTVYRAKMRCGHVIGAASMLHFARNCLDNGYFRFFCPHIDSNGQPDCNAEWPYDVIRHVTAMSAEEMIEFDTKMSENYINRSNNIKTCPGCRSLCSRQNLDSNRVKCIVCTNKHPQRSPYEFCWSCLKVWSTTDSNNVDRCICRLKDCNKTNAVNEIIQEHKKRTCPTRPIQRVVKQCTSTAKNALYTKQSDLSLVDALQYVLNSDAQRPARLTIVQSKTIETTTHILMS